MGRLRQTTVDYGQTTGRLRGQGALMAGISRREGEVGASQMSSHAVQREAFGYYGTLYTMTSDGILDLY